VPSGTSRYYALEGQVHTTRSTRGFDCSFSKNKPPLEAVE